MFDRRFVLAAVPVLLALILPPAVRAQTQTATFQIDPGHSGYVYGAGVVPPLRRAWSTPYGGGDQYVPIDDGKAFAITAESPNRLDAINLASGSVAWTQMLPGEPEGGYATVDGGRVFTAIYGGSTISLEAFRESDGAPLWEEQLTDQQFPTPPVARNGVVYLAGTSSGGTVYAVRESDGARLWTATGLAVANPVTLAGGVVVVSTNCGLAYGFDAATGRRVWTHSEGCDGGGTFMAAYDGRDVWADQNSGDGSGLVYDPADGNVVKQFGWDAPSFGYGEAVQAIPQGQGDLEIRAFDPSTMATRWAFDEHDGTTQPPPGEIVPPLGTTPLLADGYVFAAGGRGRIWALDRSTGAVVWQDDTGQAAPFYGYDPLPGLSAGEGYLIVASQSGLTAYRGSGYPRPLVRPRIAHLRLSRKRFRSGRGRGRGAVLRYELSTASTVSIAIERRTLARCARHRCIRFRTVMTLVREEQRGSNRVVLASTLKPGRYRAVVVARAPDVAASRPRSVDFVVASG